MAPARSAVVVAVVALLALVVPAGTARAGILAPLADPSPASTDTATAGPTAAPTPVPTTDPVTSAPAPSATTSSPAPVTTAPTATTGPAAPPKVPAPRTRTAAAPTTASFSSPHGPYDATSDQCALCHRAHTASGPALLVTASPQSVLCFTCHDGTGSNLNVEQQYTDAASPNDPTTATYYSHEVAAPTAHIPASGDEFRATLNRHSECGDCHDPHRGSLTDSVSTPTGAPWTASGRIAGISGLTVTNGFPAEKPAYTFVDGKTVAIDSEYQLCLKCHSGYTTLLPKDPDHPSRDMLDVGIEFNPANYSTHPVEGPGRNTTPAMALSLSGPSRFKLWNLTTASTVRCTSCHANPVASGTAQGADMAAHASPNRGILIAKYEDRVLNGPDTGFVESNFALCFLCHTDQPFTGVSNAGTNFNLHAKHTSGIGGNGDGGTSIDTPGDGQGNAICAECHFRPHSTATTPDQNTRLVTFAPDVQPAGSTLTWTPGSTAGSGSCTLTCHGFTHNNKKYSS